MRSKARLGCPSHFTLALRCCCLSELLEEIPSASVIWAATKDFRMVSVGEVIEQVPRKS